VARSSTIDTPYDASDVRGVRVACVPMAVKRQREKRLHKADSTLVSVASRHDKERDGWSLLERGQVGEHGTVCVSTQL
jgi:hypothetical protein